MKAADDRTPDEVDHIRQQWLRERPDLDTTAMGLIGRLQRLSNAATGVTGRTFARSGLTGPDFDVLATLLRSGRPYRLTPGALSAALMITTGGMSARLERLETGGLVHRESSPQDGRSRLVVLTEAGTELVSGVLEEHVSNQARLVEPLTPDERELLATLLRRLLRHVDSMAAADAAPTSVGDPRDRTDVRKSVAGSPGESVPRDTSAARD